jgi:ParB/RepB/Spo0J family partition protein
MELQTAMIDPRKLIPHPENPRGEINENEDQIISLAGDIAKHGIIEPLVATSGLVLLAGHRRRVAAIRAGLTLVPVVFRDLAAKELPEEFFYAENGHRESLSPLEEARLFISLKTKYSKQWKRDCSVADLARQINVAKHTVSMRMAILNLPERVQKLFHVGEIPMNAAQQLSRMMKWPEEVEKIADKMVTRQITLKGLDAIVTRRMKALNLSDDAKAQFEREPRLERIVKNRVAEGTYTPSLTREIVLENLGAKRGQISLFDVRVVMESTCCSCGMANEPSVCLTCPLPRFVNGLIGRSNGGDDARI